MEMFNRYNRRDGSVATGTWEQVCDLDRREWHDAVPVETPPDERPPEVLAILDVIYLDPGTGAHVRAQKAIFRFEDMVGIYINFSRS